MGTSGDMENGTVRKRLDELLSYVEALGKLTQRPIFTLAEYKQLTFAEHQLCDRIGIQHNITDADEEPIWLQIERLKRIPPPVIPAECLPWMTVANDPNKKPQIKQQRMESLEASTIKDLLDAGRITEDDIKEPLREQNSFLKYKDVVLRLANFEDIQQAINTYVNGVWASWAEAEKPRRETIDIYDKLFSLQQSMEAQGEDQALELVWGMGLCRWQYENHKIDHPLLEKLVEIDIDANNGNLRIRPRQVEPALAYGPYFSLKLPGTDALIQFFKKYVQQLSDEVEFSPYVPESFQPVLRQAATQLSQSGVYWPDVNPDNQDRKPPITSDALQVSDCWVLYARPRSASFLVEDVRRFKDKAKALDESAIPATAGRIVSELPNKPVDHGGIGIGGSPTMNPGEGTASNSTTYFPKPFNDAQLQIVKRLNHNDGAVVQGPPGTGKTHTIANIICHYLATGRTVLVTSKGEAALTVVREQIPEELRDLTISLLGTERAGFKQLEAAVRLLAGVVSQHNSRDIQQKITNLEQRVAQLNREIQTIDKELQSWGEKQLNPIEKSLSNANLQMPAMDLAKAVLEEEERHTWFPDVLGPDEKYMPQFDGQDIARLAEARKALGKTIAYTHSRLPAMEDLPDATTLTHIHQDLVHAKKIGEQAEVTGLPILAASQEDAVKRARALLPRLQYLEKIQQLAKQHGWFKAYRDHLLAYGDKHETYRLLEELLPTLRQLVSARDAFIRQPVIFPDSANFPEQVYQALANLVRGEKPFGLFGLAKKEVKAIIDGVQVGGEKPKTKEQWQHAQAFLNFQLQCKRFVVSWNSVAQEVPLPKLVAKYGASYKELIEIKKHLDDCRGFCLTMWPEILTEAKALFPRGVKHRDIASDELELKTLIRAIESSTSKISLGMQRQKLNDLDKKLAECNGKISELIKEFLDKAIGNPKYDDDVIMKHWSKILTELKRIQDLASQLEIVRNVTALIRESGASNWAAALTLEVQDDQNLTPANWRESWRWAQQKAYLKSIDGREKVKELAARRASLDNDQKHTYGELVKQLTWLGLHRNMTERVQSALQRFVAAIAKIGKGTGKRAPRHRRDAARAMNDCFAGVPCWVMPTWRVSESLPSEFGSFDLVIIDEASQSDISALPAMLRAKKVLVVGDDKQVSPTAGFIPEDTILQLKHNFLRDQPYQELLLPGASIYDLANALYPGQRIMLTEHFRCVEPIIKFSMQFYDEPLIPLRLPKLSERLDPPLIDIYVPDGHRDGRTETNELEIAAIVDEIKVLTSDEKFRGRSIGVISLIGAKQAYAIQERLLNEIGEDTYMKFNIACGDSATFQGKERDIMFLSMVVGQGQGAALTKREYEQRFNVAMSRARDRMYLVRSITLDDLKNESDLRFKVLRHFKQPMPIIENIDEPLKLCQSDFEREVFRRLNEKRYKVTPQVKVGPFSIDLVVEGENDRRLAVELDGDRYHPPEQWTKDFERQRTMERVGWTFWRCWGSSFLVDPEGCMDDLIRTLDLMGIKPGESGQQSSSYTEYREYHPAQLEEVELETNIFIEE